MVFLRPPELVRQEGEWSEAWTSEPPSPQGHPTEKEELGWDSHPGLLTPVFFLLYRRCNVEKVPGNSQLEIEGNRSGSVSYALISEHRYPLAQPQTDSKGAGSTFHRGPCTPPTAPIGVEGAWRHQDPLKHRPAPELSRCLCAPPFGVSALAESLFLPAGCWGSPLPEGAASASHPRGPQLRAALASRFREQRLRRVVPGAGLSGKASAAHGAWCGAVLGGAGKGTRPVPRFWRRPGGFWAPLLLLVLSVPSQSL